MIYCPNNNRHLHSGDQLLRRKFNGIGNYSNDTKFVSIKLVGGFERFGSYEDWGIGWLVSLHVLTRGTWYNEYAILETPLRASNRCLTCAVEAVLKKAEELEQL